MKFLALWLILMIVTAASAADAPWSVRMADSILTRQPAGAMIERKNPGDPPKWSYSVAFVVRAIADLGIRTGQSKYLNYARNYADIFVNAAGVIDPAKYDPSGYRLDDIAPGQLLLRLSAGDKTGKYLLAARSLVTQLDNQPRTPDGGFWHKKIYPNQMWLDGIYMACPFMARQGAMSEKTSASRWFDEAAKQITLIAAHTQDPASGLCYHAWDQSHREKWANPITGSSANFWGRADGWYAMAIVETLDCLPKDDPRRGEILTILRKLAGGIAHVQDVASGVWYQVLDQGSRPGNYLESSASCMFVYALARAAREGYLDPSYFDVAKRGYEGILKTFITVDAATGLVSVKDTCSVAGLGGTPYRDGSFDYYVREPRATNDPKGMAPFILASMEFESRGAPNR